MNQEILWKIWIVVAMMLGTIVTRFLPFFFFPPGKTTPKFILFLGKTLPYATMGLLVVYCLKGVTILNAPYGIPEGISVLLIVLLHQWRNNALLSIGGGTLCYMVLVQQIFS